MYNIEGWHGVTKEDVKTLEARDESLIRGLLKAHAKTASKFLEFLEFLELGTTSIKWKIFEK